MSLNRIDASRSAGAHVVPPPAQGGSGGTRTSNESRGSGSSAAPSGGGVTFGTYVSFSNTGSPSISNASQGGAFSAAFPSTLGFVTGSTGSLSVAAALQNRIDFLRLAFLTAFVELVRQRNMELLFPGVAALSGKTSIQPAKKPVTIALEVSTPSIAAVERAYFPATTANGSTSILSIVA